MTARMLLLIAAALLGGASPSARSEETSTPPKLAKCRESMNAVNAEVENSITIFRDAVKGGREEDGWSAEVKEAASQWIKGDPRIFMSVPQSPSDQAAHKAAMLSFLRKRNSSPNHGRLAWPASELADWLTSRIKVLTGQRMVVLADYAGELAAFTEDEWLKAEKPGDLRPVKEAFAALDALAPHYLNQTNLAPATQMPRGPNGEAAPIEDPRRVAAFYAALLTTGDDPLILPDPKKDVEAFTKARVIWSLLLRCNVPFQTQPRVAARVKDLDDEYAALRASAQVRLNSLILENAEPAVFEPALNYFNAFQDHFDPWTWGLRPRGLMPMRMIPMVVTDSEGRVSLDRSIRGDQIRDYHDLLGGRPGSMMGGLPWAIMEQQIRQRLASVSTAGVHRAYREWLDFRRAQASGAASGDLDSLWDALRERLMYLPRDVKICIEKRHGAPAAAEQVVPAPTPAPAPAHRETQPVAELIAALEAIAARAQSDRPASGQNNGAFQNSMKYLLGAWKAVGSQGREDAEAPPGENAGPIVWRTLAEQPDSLTLFALREKAVRFVLAQLPARQSSGAEEKAVPVRKALDAALEKCALDGDWTGFHRVLGLDSAAGLLAGGDHLRWKEIAEAFEQAAGERKTSPETARDRYTKILQLSDNAALAALATRYLKELPAQEKRP